MKTITSEFSEFIEAYIDVKDFDLDFDGYIVNHHKDLTLYVKCYIRDFQGGYTRIIKIEPQQKIKVMSHYSGLALGHNDLDFKVVEVLDKKPPQEKRY